MTMDLMVNLLRETATVLKEVHIAALKEETFYATLKITIGNERREMDARPSDAIALALRTGSPIFVSQEILDQAERDVSTEAGLTEFVAQQHTVRMAPASTDDEDIHRLAQAILRQAIHEGAQEIRFGKETGRMTPHVQYRVGEEWIDAMLLPQSVLPSLTERFVQMAMLPLTPGHIFVDHDGTMFDAHVARIAEDGGAVISLTKMPSTLF